MQLHLSDMCGLQEDPVEPGPAWHELFYWLLPEERSARVLADHPDFPGLFPGPEANGRFAETLRRASARVLNCTLVLPWGRVSGCVDVVSGAVCLYEDGHPSLAEDLNGQLSVLFEAQGATLFDVECVAGFLNFRQDARVFDRVRVTGGELTSMRAQRIEVEELQRVLYLLNQQGKLPPVKASFNGQRWGTFMPGR